MPVATESNVNTVEQQLDFRAALAGETPNGVTIEEAAQRDGIDLNDTTQTELKQNAETQQNENLPVWEGSGPAPEFYKQAEIYVPEGGEKQAILDDTTVEPTATGLAAVLPERAVEIKDAMVEKAVELKDAALEKTSHLQETAMGYKDAALEKGFELKDAAMEKVHNVQETATNVLHTVQEKVSGTIEAVKEAVGLGTHEEQKDTFESTEIPRDAVESRSI